jgi:hypothetical protein
MPLTPLQPHQQRVVAEKADLDEKINRLDAFLQSTTFNNLEPADQELLSEQVVHMRDYSAVLQLRINRF